ncbi:MAG: TetR/AcrR family transcriptional regulator [Acidimicrobiia bacterium]|nr:TetR/AcrR family transcriptional regulator [Acidimicrobiia bacterium]
MSNARQRIIEATLDLMAEHGMSGITMSGIADAAGVARQTLYNHFPSVEDIVAAALEAHRVDIGDELRVMLDSFDDPADQLAAVVRHVAVSAAHHGPLPAFRGGLSAQVRATLADHDQALLSLIAEVLAAGKASGTFRIDLDPDRDAHLIHAMLQRVPALAAADTDAAEVITVVTKTVLAAVR